MMNDPDRVQYAAIARDGSILGLGRTSDDAVDLIADADPDAPISVQHIDAEFGQRLNPPDATAMPGIALARCGVPPLRERDVMALSVAQAHAKLWPFFEGLEKRGKAVRKYDKPLGMADAWIGQNYKTSKSSPDDEAPSLVKGLTLVPASHPALAAAGDGPFAWLQREDLGRRMIARWQGEIPERLPRAFSFCSGSSKECRDSCLAFAGQNASEGYNTFRKVQQAMSLLREPTAFMRMLVEAIDRFLNSRAVSGEHVEPYFRLNVLSDLPWELIAPWLFTRFRDLQFYDYTKVPGRLRDRGAPANYDLTFSYSGTVANQAFAIDEIKHGRRVAVVLLGHKPAGPGAWQPILRKGDRLLRAVPLPRTLRFPGWPRALQVVDGDVTDVRPRDPSPSAVALRWKTPSHARAGTRVDPTDMAFVTPVFVVRGDISQVRRPNPAGDAGGGDWLIAPVSPRMQPITSTDVDL